MQETPHILKEFIYKPILMNTLNFDNKFYLISEFFEYEYI